MDVGSKPIKSPTIMLPDDAQTVQALSGVKHGVEIDAYTLASSPVVVDDSRSVAVGRSGFSVVLLPKPSCPALLTLTPPIVPTLDKNGKNSTSVQLSLNAPWRESVAPTTVTITAPGLEISAKTISVPGTLTLRVAKANRPLTKPQYFMVTLESDDALGKTRRWVYAV